MRFKGWVCAAGALAIGAFGATPALASTAARSKTAPTRYYLALGDSLSVGYQPNAQGVGQETDKGYTNDLFAYYHKKIPTLKLVELGCPGETTTSMLTGKGDDAEAKAFHCDRSGGSQLKAAEAFLKAHHKKGEVALVTLDIGANDVDGCATAPNLEQCAAAGAATIETNTPKILKGIRSAAASGTPLVATTLYDPFLAYYLEPYSQDQELAELSVTLAQDINNDIKSADTAGHFKTADVADAFSTYDQTMVAFDGQQVPYDVVRVCQLTWACTPPPQGPNIHANPLGYSVIAGAFEKVIGKLH